MYGPEPRPQRHDGGEQGMTLDEDLLGRCPDCDTPILEEQLLARYESEERRVVLAECPSCLDVVYPG